MTALTLSTLARGAPWLKAAARFLADIFEGIREGREISLRYQALSRMTDEELARRGLGREQIPQAAVSGKVRI